MGAADLLFITLSHNVSFIGKAWLSLLLALRLLLLLLAGFSLFADEQDRFVCNTIQPGCSNACFDVFAPVSVLRLWLVHLVLLFLPHLMFATRVAHKVLSRPPVGSPFASRETSLNKAPLPDLSPGFLCSYLLVVILRILVEVAFGAGQYFLFGLSIPKSVRCNEAPCTSGVECYVSRPTEKTLMLNFMLGVSSLSVLLSLADLASTVKAMVRRRKRREMLMEEMSKGEQSSVFTATTVAEEADVHLSRRASPSGSSKNGAKDEKQTVDIVPSGELPRADMSSGSSFKPADDKSQERKDTKADTTRPSTPVPTHFVLHSHLRPPLSPRPDRGPPPLPRVPTPSMVTTKLSQDISGHQSDSSESQDRRAWV
ncbi:gap junction delta-4 protein-like [Genypterus blacodes]|uniref:gap junction delta-4 protein-like n=1 Tax=Genypterus blacodes TaxID=154954 RepID=UPI003F759BEB